MPKTVYYNGKFYGVGEAVIPISDRSVFFGDAVYDVIIGHGGGLFLAEEHLHRLVGNARCIGLAERYSFEELSRISYNVANDSNLSEYLLYIQLSRTLPERTHAYSAEQDVALLLTVSPFSLSPPSRRLRLITEEDRRYGFCDVKTVNLLPAVLASHKASAAGYDEAVFVRDGVVTECAHSNISILKNGVLKTHPNSAKILPGIAKKRLLSVASDLGLVVSEIPFSKGELFSADEVLVTSTTKICLSACEIDGVAVGGKDEKTLTKLQQKLFSEYANWTM